MDDKKLLAIIIFFLITNSIALFLMLLDKTKAQIRGAERISEGMLFFMASAFGSVGVYMGMYLFHHKTRKWYFIVGIPLIFLENCAVLYVIYGFFN